MTSASRRPGRRRSIASLPKAAACSTASRSGAGPDPRFAPRRRRPRRGGRLRRYEARAGLYAYSLIARATGEDVGEGFRHPPPGAGFRAAGDGGTARDEALREALGWIKRPLSATRRTFETGQCSIRSRRTRSRSRGGRTRRGSRSRRGLFNIATILTKGRYAEAEPLFAARWRSTRRLRAGSSGWRPASTISRNCSEPRTAWARPSRSFARAGDPREAIRRRPSHRCDEPQQSRGRARRKDAWTRPSRFIAARWRSTRRASGQIIPKWRRPQQSRGPAFEDDRPGEAEPLYRRALAIDEASYGPDHPGGDRLNNLAGLLHATNRLGEAEPLYRRALAIDETSYGPDHPDVAIHLNNLAGLLQDKPPGRGPAALRRALPILEKSLAADHPNRANARKSLAALGAERGKGPSFHYSLTKTLLVLEETGSRASWGGSGHVKHRGRRGCRRGRRRR